MNPTHLFRIKSRLDDPAYLRLVTGNVVVEGIIAALRETASDLEKAARTYNGELRVGDDGNSPPR